MILDKIENCELYFKLGTRIQQAFEYLRNLDFSDLKAGKYHIDGDRLFALVIEYETKKADECLMEAHRKYLDLQYMYKGSEKIGYLLFDNQEIIKNYDSEGDYALYNQTNHSLFSFNAGSFVIFYPNDLHMPNIMLTEPEKIKKIVVKILI
jgi:YhcH/YjgK/YiaL family protein